MSEISLSKIGFFNPGRLSDQEIELGFVARQGEFKTLLDNVLSHEPNEIPQHCVLIGQRGMGKTTLLVRLGVELKKAPHKERFLPLQYPEEQYNIDRLSKFWLNSLDALADALDLEGKKDQSRELDTEIKKLSRSAPKEIYPIFQEWMKKLGRSPVLLVDNLNLIFDKISTDDQHRFRAILMSEGAPILIGASASTIKQTVEYGEPFYDAFQIKYLKKLSLGESIEVLKNLAQITGTPLHAAFSENRGRIATFHQLTGGTPRTLSMLFPLVSNGFSEEIQTDLDAVLDIITPLYKARFEELSDQMQVILDAIALHWDPIALEEIRNITQLENAKLSPQLKRLSDVGWIQRSNPGKGKGALYEISERFFNVWYLMRRSSRRQKRELYCLSRFLEVFYGDSLENVASKRLKMENSSINDAYFNLALANAVATPLTRKALQERGFDAILKHGKDVSKLLRELGFPIETIADEYEKSFNTAIDNIYDKDLEKALFLAEKLEKINPEKPGHQLIRAMVHLQKREYIGSEEAYLKAIEIDEGDSFAWFGLGYNYQINLNQFAKAEFAYKKAIKINEEFIHAWCNLGTLYMNHLNQFNKAEFAYKKAIQINEKSIYSWNNLGLLYKEYLNQFDKAESAFEKAITLGSNFCWNHLGILRMDFLHKYKEAEDAFLKAQELVDDHSYATYNLVYLYNDKLGQQNKAREMLNSIAKEDTIEDTHLLLKATFDYLDQNVGMARERLLYAFNFIGEALPSETQKDWFRTGATVVKLGYGQHLLEILEETGHDIILRPYYEAIKALMAKDAEVYFTTVAAEVREPAAKILEYMKRYNS